MNVFILAGAGYGLDHQDGGFSTALNRAGRECTLQKGGFFLAERRATREKKAEKSCKIRGVARGGGRGEAVRQARAGDHIYI